MDDDALAQGLPEHTRATIVDRRAAGFEPARESASYSRGRMAEGKWTNAPVSPAGAVLSRVVATGTGLLKHRPGEWWRSRP